MEFESSEKNKAPRSLVCVVHDRNGRIVHGHVFVGDGTGLFGPEGREERERETLEGARRNHGDLVSRLQVFHAPATFRFQSERRISGGHESSATGRARAPHPCAHEEENGAEAETVGCVLPFSGKGRAYSVEAPGARSCESHGDTACDEKRRKMRRPWQAKCDGPFLVGHLAGASSASL